MIRRTSFIVVSISMVSQIDNVLHSVFIRQFRGLGKGVRTRMFCLIIYLLVLIPVSCFVVLFSALFRLQLSVIGPTALKLFE